MIRNYVTIKLYRHAIFTQSLNMFLSFIKNDMKKLTKLFTLAIVLFAFGTAAFAQATASATASATIILPITLTWSRDMNFGNVAVIGAGTVVLVPAGTRTNTGGVTLPVSTGTVTSASFTVGGEGSSTYAITLPTSDYIITNTIGSGGETMTVNTFTSTPSATGTLTTGTQTLNVGATLNINAAQVYGLYTNATGFDVTVNYN
jgi:hypothetical protein